MVNQIFAITVLVGLLIGGALIAYIGYRVIKMLFPPGLLRGAIGLVFWGIWSVSIYGVLRAYFGAGVPAGLGPVGANLPALMYKVIYEFLSGETLPTVPEGSLGAFLFFFGFGAAGGWLWGVGSFNPKLSEHGESHAPEPAPVVALVETRKAPNPIAAAVEFSKRPAVRSIVSTVVPLIRPMIGILGFSAIVLVVVMVLFSNSLVPVAVQTRVPDASVVTPAGSINLPFNGADGHPIVVSKTIFFVGLVLIVLVTLGIMGLLLALLMNWLSAEVKVAKTMPDSPPQHEPLLFRLIDFFLGWVGDMLETTRKSVLR